MASGLTSETGRETRNDRDWPAYVCFTRGAEMAGRRSCSGGGAGRAGIEMVRDVRAAAAAGNGLAMEDSVLDRPSMRFVSLSEGPASGESRRRLGAGSGSSSARGFLP